MEVPSSGRSIPLQERLGRPEQVCVLDSDPLAVLALATEYGYIDLVLLSNIAFEPVWQTDNVPLMMRQIESIMIVDAKLAKCCRLDCRGSTLYYTHSHGVALVEVCWAKCLHEVSDAAALTELVSTQPTICRHLVSSSSVLICAAWVKRLCRGLDIIICHVSVICVISKI